MSYELGLMFSNPRNRLNAKNRGNANKIFSCQLTASPNVHHGWREKAQKQSEYDYDA